jgi:CHAT domain-containing protein
MPTALLLRQFYVNMEISLMDPAEALRAAALWLRSLDVMEVARLAGVMSTRRPPTLSAAPATATAASARFPYAHPYYWAGLTYTGSSMSGSKAGR